MDYHTYTTDVKSLIIKTFKQIHIYKHKMDIAYA